MRTWILQRWQVYARVVLLSGVFLSPVIFHRATQDVFNLLKFTVLWVCGIAAIALYVAWAAERGVWFPPFNLAFAGGAFIVACIFATFFSSNPMLSLVGLYHRYGGLIPFLLYFLLMLVVVGLYWEKPRDLADIAKASAGASVLLLSYVLIQAAGQDWIAWKDSSGGPPPFPVGTMGNSNFAGGYLGIAIPFLIYSAATAKRDYMRLILFALTGLDLLALWFTQTRGGMIAAGAGLVTMGFMYRDRLPRALRLAPHIGSGLAALIALAVLWHPGSDKPYGPLQTIDTFRTGTFNVRTYYWGTAFRIFRENPIVGVGLDLYYANYPRHRLPQDGAELGLTITDKPHNIFLEYAANGGILTIGSYLFLVGLGLWYGYRKSHDLPDEQRFLLVTFVAVLVGYLAQGLFSIDVPPLAAMGWLALGGIAAIADPRVIRSRERLLEEPVGKGKGKKKAQRVQGVKVKRQGPALWPVHGVALGASLILVLIGVQPVLADVAAKSATNIQTQQGSQVSVQREFERAIERNPLEASYRSQAGSHLEALAAQAKDPREKVRLYEKALEYYNQALEMQPGNIFYIMNHARLFTSWANEVDPEKFELADDWWKKTVEHDPTDWDVHNRYALMLNAYANQRKGDVALRRRTVEELRKVIEIRPEYTAAWINLGKVHLAIGEPSKARLALLQALKYEPNNEEANKLIASLPEENRP